MVTAIWISLQLPLHGFSSGDSDEITWYENDGNADPTWTGADIDMDEVAQVRECHCSRYGWRRRYGYRSGFR